MISPRGKTSRGERCALGAINGTGFAHGVRGKTELGLGDQLTAERRRLSRDRRQQRKPRIGPAVAFSGSEARMRDARSELRRGIVASRGPPSASIQKTEATPQVEPKIDADATLCSGRAGHHLPTRVRQRAAAGPDSVKGSHLTNAAGETRQLGSPIFRVQGASRRDRPTRRR